jgi:superfamily II DNA or RNA helicase
VIEGQDQREIYLGAKQEDITPAKSSNFDTLQYNRPLHHQRRHVEFCVNVMHCGLSRVIQGFSNAVNQTHERERQLLL